MTTFADFLRWSPGPLAGLSAELDGLATSAALAASDLVGVQPAGWTGQAATAARGSLAATTALADEHATDVRTLAAAVARATDELTAALRDRDAALDRAATQQVQVSPDGTLTDAAQLGPDEAIDPGQLAARQAVVDELAAALSRSFSAALTADVALAAAMGPIFRSGGRIRDDGAGTGSPPPPGVPVDDYRVGPPTRPEIQWDEDYQYGSASPEPKDYLAREAWLDALQLAKLSGLLPDGAAMYEHYWSNTGSPVTFDYERAVREDAGVAKAVAHKIDETAAAVDRMVASGQNGEFDITGPATPTTNDDYPTTENWRKAIGGHQQWSSAHVTVKDGTVTMEVTVHGEDHYNFNRGQQDINTGLADSHNGRFTEIGWAKPFDSSGTVTRTITWPVGSPPPVTDLGSSDPGRTR